MKTIKICCEEMRSTIESEVMTYNPHSKTWQLFIEDGHTGDPFLEPKFCPACGKKIELEAKAK